MPAKWKDVLAGLPAAVEEAVDQASRDAAEALNQAVRRIAHAPNVTDALNALVDSSPPFCTTTCVLSLDNNHAEAIRTRGTANGSISFPVADAPALVTLLETKDPVTAAATASELSEPLATALENPDGKVYLFPVKVRKEVVVALAAAGSVQPGAMELLCEAASLKLEILLPPPPPPPAPEPAPTVLAEPEPEPVANEPEPVAEPEPRPTKPEPPKTGWDSLAPDVQRVHLQAQRFARVKVAELRIYHADAVREGRANSNIYGALREPVDALRADFRKHYTGATPTMVDYLHLEILRTLAHDDDTQLGPDYPGPIA